MKQMRMVGLGAFVLSLLGCSSNGDSASAEAVARTEEQLVGGRAALESEYPSTVTTGFCTAVKVGPRHFLMAAHCVEDSSTNQVSVAYAPGNWLNFNSANDNSFTGDHWVTIAQVTIFPEWLSTCTNIPCPVHVLDQPHAPDVSLVVVTSDTPDIPAATIDATPVVPGQQVTITGYGCENGYGQPWSGSPRLKIQEVAALNSGGLIHDGTNVAAGDEPNVAASYVITPGVTFNPGAASLCPGDSGGPLFRRNTSLVVGVNAYYSFLPDGTGKAYTNWHTRLDSSARFAVTNWLRGLGASVSGSSSGPYGGTPRNVTSTIQAEDYDLGGQGIAYNDTTTANSGGAYRATEGVDLENTTDVGAGVNVGWINAGEWLQYSVTSSAAIYDATLRIASTNTTPKLHLEVDGVNVTGSVTLPRTGGNQLWQTVTIPNVQLTNGPHLLRVVFETNGINFNWLRFAAPQSTPYGGTPRAATSTIQAEDYDVGGQNVAFYDIDVNNNGGKYRTTEAVDVQSTGDAGLGYNVGWTRPGEWLKYTISVATSGLYELQFRASSAAGNRVSVTVDGSPATSFAMPNTSGAYQTVLINGSIAPAVSLTSGTHQVQIGFEGSGVNFNWFSFRKL